MKRGGRIYFALAARFLAALLLVVGPAGSAALMPISAAKLPWRESGIKPVASLPVAALPWRELDTIAPAMLSAAALAWRMPADSTVPGLDVAGLPWKRSTARTTGSIPLPLAWVPDFSGMQAVSGMAASDTDAAAPLSRPVYVTALCRDDRTGDIWAATEGSGLWRLRIRSDPGAPASVPGLTPVAEWTAITRAGTGGGREENGPALATGTPAEFSLADDNLYALAVDHQGRLWAGTLNHGVSVYNGEKWRNYDMLTGPLGERVFDLAVCPVDGDVWVATNAGLARWSPATDTWSYVTRADGLPSDQIQSLAFASDGTLFAGTQCEGLAICQPEKALRTEGAKTQRKTTENAPSPLLFYKSWQGIRAPETFWLPPAGTGLPSNLINDILVLADGTVAVATTRGLAWWTSSQNQEQDSTEGAETQRNTLPLLRASAPSVKMNYALGWRYLRGADWEAAAKGLFQPPSAAELAMARATFPTDGRLLPEDYLTCLGADAAGNLWLGTRRFGCHILPAGQLRDGVLRDIQHCELPAAASQNRDFVFSLLPPAGNHPAAIGWYGGGVTLTPGLPLPTDAQRKNIAPGPTTFFGRVGAFFFGGASDVAGTDQKTKPVALPSPARPPTAAELQTLLDRLPSPVASVVLNPEPNPTSVPPSAIFLGDDWRTWGDWVERYGRRYARLCATNAPAYEDTYFYELRKYSVKGFLGPHHTPDDSLRHWIHWIVSPTRRSLYRPNSGVRTQAEWDDHGEAYPLAFEGPDLWVAVRVPAGDHVISLYFMNKDGEGGMNRVRDYKIEVHALDVPQDPKWTTFKVTDAHVEGARQTPPLAQCRIRDFRGGVYKRFFTRGGSVYWFHVQDNGSFNTILSGIFVDKWSEPFLDPGREGWLGCTFERVRYRPKTDTGKILDAATGSGLELPLILWRHPLDAAGPEPGIFADRRDKLFAYRFARDILPDSGKLEEWKWELRLWESGERERFWDTMMLAWGRQQAKWPIFRSPSFRPFSPVLDQATVSELEKRLSGN